MCFAFSGHVSLGIAMALAFANSQNSDRETLINMVTDEAVLFDVVEIATELWSVFKWNPSKGVFYQALRPSLSPRLFRGRSAEVVSLSDGNPSFGKYGMKYAIVFS